MPPELRSQLQDTLAGSYLLERELGGGGMSRVFLADEVRLGRKVVIKVLSAELTAGVNAERFEREIRLAASLQQANIVPVLSAGDVGGLPYYTMPFVEGESLRARLSTREPISVTEVVRILGDVSRALAYAHEHGVVHRDIKPDNVLLSGGTAVVTDFGIAKALSASRAESGATLTQVGTAVGTPAYMAPEQVAGDPDVDHRADLYAFGCMAYELLGGKSPFDGRTPQRILAAHVTEAPRPVTELRADTPAPLATLVMRCLAKEPGDRPASARELVAVLDSATTGTGISTGSALTTGRVTLRNALLLYVGASAAVALVARAAIITIGLPDWVFAGALVVMGLGLPVILFTGYVQHAAARRPPTPDSFATKAAHQMTWARTAKGGSYALVAFAALVAVFMGLRAYGIGPAGSLVGAKKLKEHQLLLVADFRVPKGDSSLASVISEAVRSSLRESSMITVVEPSAVVATLGRMHRAAETPLDPELARDVATRDGATAIVDGDVTPLGAAYVVSLRLVRTDSGNVLASFRETAAGPTDLIGTLDKLTRQLRGRIGESLKRVQGSEPLEQVTTRSLDALRAYAAGSKANDEGLYPAAIQSLEQAVGIDSEFAMAWRKLAVARRNQGGDGAGAHADSAMTNAIRYSARLTPRERLLCMAYYYENGVHADRVKAVAAYDSVLAIAPDDFVAMNNLSFILEGRRELARAESLLVKETAHPGAPVQSLMRLVNVQASLGQFKAADSTLAASLAVYPRNTTLKMLSATLAYDAGNIDSAIAIARRLTLDSIPLLRTRAYYTVGDLAMVRGQLHQYERAFAAGRALERSGTSPVVVLDDSLTAAFNEGWFLGRNAEALARIDAIVAHFTPAVHPDGDAAAIYALLGAPAKARTRLIAAEAALTDSASRASAAPGLHQIRGMIALADHHPLDAVTEFRAGDRVVDGPADGCTVCLFFVLGQAYDQAGMIDSAIANLERFVRTPYVNRLSQARDGYFLAGSFKRLGELYEGKGDSKNAISNFQRFIDLWKDADPELQPKVREVRDRLARLQRSGG